MPLQIERRSAAIPYPRGFARRNAQSQAMRFLNRSRADLRAAHKRYAAAVAAVLALTPAVEA